MNNILAAFVIFKTEEGHDEAQNYISNPSRFVNKNSKLFSLLNLKSERPQNYLDINHTELLGDKMVFD